VLQRAQAAIWDHAGTGVGILEHSHRGKPFLEVLAHADERMRRLAGIGDDHAILYLQGGASAQFFMLPMSFLGAGATADYCDTGAWSAKAIADARRYGGVHLACSSQADKYTYVPTELQWSAAPVYAHFTSNETIHGVQWASPPVPPPGVPLICDASSDIFSRPIDVAAHDLIYAGAQKNLGPSGVTVVIARKSFLERGSHDLPALLQYRTYVADPMPNTPSTFGIYVVAEVLAWIEAQGGLAAMAEHNAAKAQLLYDYLDDSKRFSAVARPGSRSTMNVVFRTGDPATDKAFIAEAERQGLAGLAGHRSVGGMRASIYNAFPIEGVRRLIEVMKAFELTSPAT
jgi:phosphoserine aminotransferase